MTGRVGILPRLVALGVSWTFGHGAWAQVAPASPTTLGLGDWQITPVGDLRVRGEYRRDLDDQDQGTLLERTRLGAAARSGPVEIRLVMQDARALSIGGGLAPVVGPAPISATGAYEAWVDAHTGSQGETYLRVGRQAVAWGEGRLVGANDWSPAGRSLDAVRGRVVTGDLAFELLAAVLLDPSTPDVLSSYGELAGARAQWAIDPLLALDASALARFASVNPVDSLGQSVRGQTYTAALLLHGRGLGWSWGAEGAGQIGHADDLGVDRRAFAAAGHLAKQLDRVLLQPTFGIGGSYASGDRGGSTFGTFDPLLPDAHAWHGAMDLVSWSNEAEVSAFARAVPWRDGDVSLEYRYLGLAEASSAWESGYLVTVGSAPGNRQGSLGHEVDVTARWSPWSPVSLEAGYGLLALGAGARAVLADGGIGAPQASGALLLPTVSHFGYLLAGAALP